MVVCLGEDLVFILLNALVAIVRGTVCCVETRVPVIIVDCECTQVFVVVVLSSYVFVFSFALLSLLCTLLELLRGPICRLFEHGVVTFLDELIR